MLVTIFALMVLVVLFKSLTPKVNELFLSAPSEEVMKHIEYLASLPELQNVQSFGELGRLAKNCWKDCYDDMTDEEVGERLMTKYSSRFFSYTASPVTNLIYG